MIRETIHTKKSKMQISNKVLLTNGKYEDKLQAHIKGSQHYAYSVFIFDSEGRLLLQQRALSKYHSGGLWSNTCCSHPLVVDDLSIVMSQAISRVKEEMGIECHLFYDSCFEYKASCGDLIENEIDYIFYGYALGVPEINTEEVHTYRWANIADIHRNIEETPDSYTEWFKSIVLEKGISQMADSIKSIFKKGNIARITY